MDINLSDLAPCGLVYTNAAGVILSANPAFNKMAGIPDRQSPHKFQECFTPAGRLLYELHHLPMLALQGYASELSYEIKLPSGEPVPVSVTSQTHLVNGVKIYCHAVFERSNSNKHENALIQKKQESESALQKRIAFMSMASHEIKNPLQLMQTATDLLQQGDVSREQKTYLNILKTSTDALLKVTADIMQTGQLDNPQIQLQPVETDLHAMLKRLVSSFGIKAEEKKLQLTLSSDEKIPASILADETKLQVVLTNLLSNAIKYTKEGSVFVSAGLVRQTEGTVTISFKVEDTGIGIPSEKLSSIFELYRQVDGRSSGFGLGLGIAQRIARLMGSTINVETGPFGSTFSFTVTFGYTSNKISRLPSGDQTKGKMSKILLAEDNALNAELMTRMLTSGSHAVTAVSDGKKAWELLNVKAFDLVLADLQMPEMDGLELLKNIRSSANEKIKNLPVIIISGESLIDHAQFVSQYRPTEWLAKPFRMNDLLTKVSGAAVRTAEMTGEPFPKIRSLCSDREQYTHVLEKTLTMLESDQRGLAFAIAEGNGASIKRIIHKLNTSLSYLGESALSERLTQLSELASQKNFGINVDSTFVYLINTDFDRLKDSIKQALTNGD